MKQLNWGIVSAGKISHDFTTALTLLPAGEHKVVAVAAGDKERAKKFADSHKIPKHYQGYDDLAKDSEVGKIFFWDFLIIIKRQYSSVGFLRISVPHLLNFLF